MLSATVGPFQYLQCLPYFSICEPTHSFLAGTQQVFLLKPFEPKRHLGFICIVAEGISDQIIFSLEALPLGKMEITERIITPWAGCVLRGHDVPGASLTSSHSDEETEVQRGQLACLW